MDINEWIAQTTRDVRPRSISGGTGYAAVARRTYDASAEEVWNALTSPERVAQWFLPVSGDLRKGGTFQLEGHAGGDILECDRPHRFHLTWKFEGHSDQEVVVTLVPEGDGRTTLELEHVGPGDGERAVSHVLAVGAGWDPALVGFGHYVTGDPLDKQFWFESEEALEFTKKSVRAWAEALESKQVASSDVVSKVTEETLKFYTPE
ncbi:SRPBCC family protein [Saccharomonospora iraqiensis]|uniref:SRPBCC family protein n=1 Tax=Saccharomonospora iraqiensis TaxID=52698 RepID=UPI00022E6E55|nr:SRPBCC family protein [Saccharomonospora iraqiensis]